MRKLTLAFTLVALLALPLHAADSPGTYPAQYSNDENAFFSYKRFYSQLDILENSSRDTKTRSDVRYFMRSFVDGVLAISAGDPEKAKAKLLQARAMWPEYFGTDFLLARVNEDAGNYKLSAMFFKSYLNKLKAFSEGRYRVSGPLMRGITPYRIENYDEAYALVKRRLAGRGIGLSMVQPFYTMPDLLKYLIIFLMLVPVYAIMVYGVIPAMKRRHRMKHPPEGFWVCKKCGQDNPNIWLECERCGEKHRTLRQ